MKFTTISPFFLCLVLVHIPVVSAAGKVRGVKATSSASRTRRLMKGPKERACDYNQRKNEVTFSCNSRQGVVGGDKGGKGDSRDSASSNQVQSRGINLDLTNVEDEITYKVASTGNGMGINVAYKNKVADVVDGSNVKTDTNTEFQIVFTEIIEYAKGSSDTVTAARSSNTSFTDQTNDLGQAYDWGNDEVIQSLSLSKWQDFSSVRNGGDGIVSYFFVETKDGVAQFNFTITQADQGEKASANTVKIDVRIVNFPWLRDDTNVALLSTVQSQQNIHMHYDDNAVADIAPIQRSGNVSNVDTGNPRPKHVHTTEQVQIDFADATKVVDGGFAFGAYTWEKLAVATVTDDHIQIMHNGTNMTLLNLVDAKSDNSKTSIQVLATSPEDYSDSSIQTIAYSFVGGGAQGSPDIYWDPEAGVDYETYASAAFSQSQVTRLTIFCGALASTALLLLLA